MEELEKQKRITKKLRKIEMTLIITLIIIFIIFIIGTIIIGNTHNNRNHHEMLLKQAIELFNYRFSIYVGKNVDYNTAKQCIIAIEMNNQDKSDSTNHIIDCNLTRVTELEKDKKYTIDCKYDSNGYINYITITKEGE